MYRHLLQKMSIVWSNERVLQLIELYQNSECLWDTTHNEYKNKLKKRDAWDSISKILDVSLKDVESKIHTLRSQFTRERKKFKSSKKTESGSEDIVRITWFAYEPLQFLLKGESLSGNDDTEIDESISTAEVQQLNVNEEQDNEFQKNDNSVEVHSKKKRILIERVSDPYEVMIDGKKRLKVQDNTDEFDVYGKYVASELRNIKDEYSSLIAKQHINNILIDARVGKYRQEFNPYGYKTGQTSEPSTSTNVEDSSHSVNSEQEFKYIEPNWVKVQFSGQNSKLASSSVNNV